MSKKTINLGAVVDDYTGDYLRKGGQKINDNFDEIYAKLGDTLDLHPAGAWENFVALGGSPIDVFSPTFGSETNLDSALGIITVALPAVTSSDYGKVIKIRDVEGTWATNNVSVTTPGVETINGSTSALFDANYTEVTFVYTIGGWKYIPGIRLDGFATESATAGVNRYDFTATSGQTVFTPSSSYNVNAVEVYRNGALLFYSATAGSLDSTSDYGSSDIGDNLVVLNGTNIKLREASDLNDIITIITYTQSVSAAVTSYRRYSVTLVDQNIEPSVVSIVGQIIARPSLDDSLVNRTFSLVEFTGIPTDEFNPNAFQLFLNGTLLTQAGTANLPGDETSPIGEDEYRLDRDINLLWNQIILYANDSGDESINQKIKQKNGDILTIVFFNNELGSILPWSGQDSIQSRGNEVWLNTEVVINRTNKIGYSETGGNFTPESSNVVAAPSENNITIRTIQQLFDAFHPIGSTYENASNPANPADYMGFGTWRPYAEGKVTFGFDENDSNSPTIFGTAQIGVASGNKEITLSSENIPELELTKDLAILYNDDSGEINISGCEPLPGESPYPAVASLSSETVVANENGSSPQTITPINILPPHIVSYKWVRVA